MVVDCLKRIFLPVFQYCAHWTNQLLDKIGGDVVILAAFTIVLIIGMLFIPMRGGNIVAGWDSVRDFNMSAMHKGKYSSGKVSLGTRSKVHKGKFEHGNKSAQAARKAAHRDL